MNLRHARAIAVFGIAVLALTGARGSHGGGCSGSSSGSSSSSGGSNHHSDDDNTSGSSVSGGGGSRDTAVRDVTIDKCAYDAATKSLTARITVKNDGALDRDYSVTVKFTGTAATAVPATAVKTGIAVAAGASASAELSTPYPGTGDGSEYTECEVTRAGRI
ncbi:hypothetical protein [Streptomyces griseus]|uniref:hypothetical protein n=1 Tax=Streptomyces griseus TaxID=1911 RepID=UPI0004C6FD17|nr:hypothetical protein [Streptomyces griseus]